MQEFIKVMQGKIKAFNEIHPVGTSVIVIKDNGELLKTKVRHPAEIMGGHTAVVWLNDISGAYSLNRIIA